MMKKISLTGPLRGSRDTGKIVKYTPCSKQELQLDDDLDEIAVVSNAAPESVKYGGSSLTANGPRVVPGIITSTGGERSRLVSERRTASNTKIHASSPLYAAKSIDNLKSKCGSRQSLLESVSSRVHGDHKRHSRESMAYINRAHVGSDLEISRKTREIRRKEIKREFEKWETSTSGSDKTTCKWTFVFDPSGRLCYYWSMVVSVAFLYNFWVLVYRYSFQEINGDNILGWFAFDYLSDLIYILDVGFQFRTGYLEEGVLQTESTKLRQHYMNSTIFYIDCLCLLPLDFLYLSIGFRSILRCFRLVKIYRFWAFLDRTERHTNYPNVFRTLTLIHYLLVIFHWNACLYNIILENNGFGSQNWFVEIGENCSDVLCKYMHAFYWSTLALTTIGDLPRPRTKAEYIFLTTELIFGLFLFATVLGYVANIVTNVSAARKEFQAKLDAVKTYMRMRRVPEPIQNKVIRWFDYLWMTQKSSDEERSVGCLPDKLKAEIAIHVHLDTLKRVEIFQNTEAGFLCELVLRLRPVLFSPGDYICRKGEVGKEMYIVSRGRLQVVTDNGKTTLATLRAGSYFGEISILNMGTAGNRRTASVRSVGYSDLFCLYKQDMWDVLKDYPAARIRLEAIAVKRLEKYKKEPLRKRAGSRAVVEHHPGGGLTLQLRSQDPLEATPTSQVAMGRSRSTPGLVESRGKVTLEEMEISQALLKSSGLQASSRATLMSDETPGNSTAQGLSGRDLGGGGGGGGSSASSSAGGSSRGSIGVKPVVTPSTAAVADHHYETIPPQITYTQLSSVHTYGQDVYRRGVASSSQTNLLSPSPYYGHPTSDYSTGVSPSDTYGIQEPRFAVGVNKDSTQDALMAEIKRLRERLVTLEAENASMSMKLSQQQWEVENRLAEIELQICGASGPGGASSVCTSSGSGDENERNRESII